eukprot:TRINITY_DN65129_c0_g1_i1.p1 TRINITY_DN65129_c0_g1~~TRINITY_DN65129_c0_g1_i1.p1  ORF type:complete len:203 (-),score=35.23 TRINITY_DN65129_c0_g1_i1:120-677(-)
MAAARVSVAARLISSPCQGFGLTFRGGSLSSSAPAAPASLRHFAAESGVPRLRLRGLPFAATAADVAGVFKDFRLAPGSPAGQSVEVLRGHSSRPTGQAFAYFVDVAEAMKAKDAINGQPCFAVGSNLYRLEVMEDFKDRRVIITDEDAPGDITEEGLRDKVRRSMVGKEYAEKAAMKKFKYRQW